jgi:putative membrane protein
MPNADPPGTDPRVLLAAERTLLAWIRTGIALMGFGFVVARFGFFLRELAIAGGRAEPTRLNGPSVGVAVVAVGVLVNFWASLRHRRMVRRFRAGDTNVESRGPVTVGIATVVGGLVLLAVLLTALLQ